MYEKAQLFLLPSYSENFGIVVAEAMAMGCPVVVTPEVGIAQLVESAGAGVVASNDPPKLAAAIVALLADEARRRELGGRGREFARAHLSWTGVVEQMEHLYQQASDGRTLPAQAPELGRT
jgi:glycosyltransferase involved in cell wall biosynthesis